MTRSFWTDDEFSVLQSHPNWTDARLAEELGRTVAAVHQQRALVKNGKRDAAAIVVEWDEDEDDLLRALAPVCTRTELVGHFPGRTYEAIRHRLTKLGIKPGVSGKLKSPHTVAGRPLLAKTCTKCGLLLAAGWFYFDSSKRKWSPSCKACKSKQVGESRAKSQEALARHFDRSDEIRARYQAITKAHATRVGYEWTSSDMEILRDPDLTLLQKALRLSRTYEGTRNAAQRHGVRSAVALGDPEVDQWTIDNPNAGRVDEIAEVVKPTEVLVAGRPEAMW